MNETTQKIIHGDCLDELKKLPDCSVDSVVTDPPYGISFMGKKWDYDVPQVEVWKECLRVLKPGGHALVACGTRTQHRMAVNLEDAGFEIRDIVAWIYGSGFPKSLNIGKAVDKLQGNERKEVGKNPNHRESDALYELGFQGGKGSGQITKGTSEWEGWGTALKPAMELWTLCRKPLEENTVAENVLKYGVGGLNIDGCRVGTVGGGTHCNNRDENGKCLGHKDDNDKYHETFHAENKDGGRFPANLIHDGSDEVVSGFPNTKSIRSARGGNKTTEETNAIRFGSSALNGYECGYDDSGSASRFFYCAKASKNERNKWLEGFDEKPIAENTGENHNVATLGRETKYKNNHPTVKPVSLMRYLCKLVTPPKGIVLDPFCGSGTTGIGAKMEGFDFIGIEREEEYVKIAEARIIAWEPELQESLFTNTLQVEDNKL